MQVAPDQNVCQDNQGGLGRGHAYAPRQPLRREYAVRKFGTVGILTEQWPTLTVVNRGGCAVEKAPVSISAKT